MIKMAQQYTLYISYKHFWPKVVDIIAALPSKPYVSHY